MNGTTAQRRYGAVAIAAAATLILLMMFPGIGNFALGSQPNDCSARYIAYDGTGNQFGPKQTAIIAKMKTDLTKATDMANHRVNVKTTCDNLYASAFVSFVKYGYALDVNQVEARAATYLKDRKVWKADVKWAMSQVKNTGLSTESASYETLAMKVGTTKTVMPSLFKVNEHHALGPVLVLQLKDGTTRELRVICDFQMSAPTFPNVPNKPRPPRQPKPTPHCTTGCTPHPQCTLQPPSKGYSVNTSTCTLYKNGENTYACQQNGGPNCPPNAVVQNGTAGTKGKTPGAGTRPQPLPVVPKPPAGQPNPTPNASGYNSGGGTNSAPNGGSCNNGTCDNRPDPTTPPDNTGQGGSNASPVPSDGGPG